jgi:hypothetical protein
VSDAGTTHDSTLYIVASTGWVPPVTVSSPSRTGSLQAAQTVSGWNSAPQVCWKMTGSAPGLTYSVAPFFEREQDGPKGLPGVSQEVLVAWRTLRILPALDHACLFEFAQPCGEHVARCPGAHGDVLKAGVSVANLAGHQQCIAVADDRERIGDGAHSWGKFAFWTHR